MKACRTLKHSIMKGIRDDRGISILEFAIIALPFLTVIFAILEVGFIYWGSYELDNATLSAARLIRTGQAQTANMFQAGMISQICSQVFLLPNCTSKLQLNVQNFSNFASVKAPNPLNGQGNLSTSFPYQPGGPSTVNLVTSFYEWPLINFVTLAMLGNLADGNRLLQSSAVFKSEPYPPAGL
jgi:Flp pilus assembly protein TadG